jgi:hypothetical protein
MGTAKKPQSKKRVGASAKTGAKSVAKKTGQPTWVVGAAALSISALLAIDCYYLWQVIQS